MAKTPCPQMSPPHVAAGTEPRLGEIMDDPITHRLMASDGVDREEVFALVRATRARLARLPG